MSADNPASAALGGFKESASAFRFCRHCLGTDTDIQTKVNTSGYYTFHVPKVIFVQFIDSDFTIRGQSAHSAHCDLLEREDLSVADRQHYSTVYGVNRRSLLNSLEFFDVASGALIPDIMHDILEGALPLEVKLMLKVDSVVPLNIHCTHL